MKSSLRTLYQCPYCLRSRGLVTLDLHAVDQLTTRPQPPVDLDPGTSTDLSPFIFAPDIPGNRPCPHLICYYIDVTTEIQWSRSRTRRVLDLTLNWTDPALKADPYGEDLAMWLWGLLVDGEESAWAPSSPHVVRILARSFRLPKPNRAVHVGGTLLAVMDPVGLLKELPKLYEQYLSQA